VSINTTPQEEKSELTRQSLINSAKELFIKYGVKKVTINDICNNCGLTKGSFYYYFPSKNHIVAIFLNSGLDDHIESNYTLDQSLSYREQLANYYIFIFDYFVNLGKQLTGLSFLSLINASVNVEIKGRPYVDTLASIITQAQKDDSFDINMNEEETYYYFTTIITGILMEWCISEDNSNNIIDWKKLIKKKSELCFNVN